MTATPTASKVLRDTARNETALLIASDKVEGTAVYGADGKKIGRIENVMIDKFTGQVAYSVLSFGGLLGMGQDHYPLPWAKLKKQLQGAPKYREDNSWHSGVDEYWEDTFV